jgi:hypothetical protein
MQKSCEQRKFHRVQMGTCTDCGQVLTTEEAEQSRMHAEVFDKWGLYPGDCWECGGPCRGCWG